MPKSIEVIRALERAGADIIELGVPFSRSHGGWKSSIKWDRSSSA